MPARLPKPAAWMAIALAVAAAGCSDGDAPEEEGERDRATVYSSLPLEAGPHRGEAAAIEAGIERALAERGGRVGDLVVEYRSLDNTTPDDGGVAPEEEAANARNAAQDDTAVAYIGSITFAATAISIPILNEGGMIQVSPAATYDGLTKETEVTQPGEPEKYYPTGERSFARIVPIDGLQADVLAGEMAAAGCERAFVAAERETASVALARLLTSGLPARGVPVGGEMSVDSEAPDLGDVGEEAERSGADCAVFAGTATPAAVAVYERLAAALPDARLFGSHGVCRPAFADPAGGLPAEIAGRFSCTSFWADLGSYPGGDDVGVQSTAALYGYEAMQLVLDAIEEGQGDRLAVREALLAAGPRDSPLGDYGLDDSGDTTLDEFAVYRIRSGRLRQEKLAEAGG